MLIWLRGLEFGLVVGMYRVFDEEAVKAAFFSAGVDILKEALEASLGVSISDLVPVMREVPIAWDKRFADGRRLVPLNLLYRTGRMLVYSDMLLYGVVDGEPTLFLLEFKVGRLIAVEVVVPLTVYALGLPVLLKYDGIGWPARIFRRYVEEAFSFKGIRLEGRFRVQPVLVYIGPEVPRFAEFPRPRARWDVKFRVCHLGEERCWGAAASRELLEFLDESCDFGGVVDVPVLYFKPSTTYDVLRRFSGLRRRVLKELYPGFAGLHRVLDSLPEAAAPAYVSVRGGRVVVRTLELSPQTFVVGEPPRGVELPRMTRGKLHFVELQRTLEESSGSEVVVQLYLNGPSHPKLFFEVGGEYVSFEHSAPYALTFDGCFNRVVAWDAFPLSEKTIVDQVVAPFKGKYYVERLLNTRILRVVLELESLSGSKSKLQVEFHLLAPKLDEDAKRADVVLPYMREVDVEELLRRIPLDWRYYNVLITPMKMVKES